MITDSPDYPATELFVEPVGSVERLAKVQQGWLRLVETAIEPNVFFEPLCLLPALLHLREAQQVRCVLIWARPRNQSAAQDAGYGDRVLCGLFPIYAPGGLGLRHGIWCHKYAFSGVPLVRSDCARAVLSKFLDWLEAEKIRSFRWPEFHTGGSLYDELLRVAQLRGLPMYVQKNYLRAEFRPAPTMPEYLRRALSTRTRKELLRMERRLQETGDTCIESLDSKSDVQAWTAEFLQLEAAGWKGDNSTALGTSPEGRQFFESMVHAVHANGRLIMLKLSVDAHLVAMNVGLRTADGGYYFKIAHAESFRRFMPGRLLELAFMRWLHAHPEIRWFDSCAQSNHQMIDRLWDERRLIQSFWLGGRGNSGRLSVAARAGLSVLKNLVPIRSAFRGRR